jgi:hypothetical protein
VTGGVRIPELVAGLVSAGMDMHAVWPMDRSLEDLYVALHANRTHSRVHRASYQIGGPPVTWPAIWAIVRKDLASVLRNRGVRIPLLVTPIIILVFLPILLVGGGELLASSGTVPLDAVGSSPLDRLADPQLQERVRPATSRRLPLGGVRAGGVPGAALPAGAAGGRHRHRGGLLRR